ncbi:MAG: DUF6603 domain-containing protein [Saprospiraceae bacterium]
MGILTDIKNKYRLVGGTFELKASDFPDDPEVAGGFGRFIRNGLLANGVGTMGNPPRIELDKLTLSADEKTLTFSGKTNRLFFAQQSDATIVVTEAASKVHVVLTSTVTTNVPYPLDALEWVPLKAMRFSVTMSWDDSAKTFKLEESRGGVFALGGGGQLRMEMTKLGGGQWRLALSQTGDTPLALGDVGKILNLENEVNTFLPQGFRDTAAGSLAITALSATIDISAKKFINFTLETALVGKTWKPVTGIEIGALKTNFLLVRNAQNQLSLTTVFSGDVSGHPFSLTGVLNSTEPWEATLGNASIADVFGIFLKKSTISPAELFEGTVVAEKFDLGLQVYFQEHTDAEGETTPKGSYRISLDSGAEAGVGANLSLENLGFAFLQNAEDATKLEPFFVGKIALNLGDDTHTLELKAKIPENNADALRLEAALEANIPVGRFVNFLTNKGFGVSLPGSLEDFALTSIGFAFALTPKANQTEKDKELTFSCKGSLPLDGGLSLDPEVELYYKKEVGKTAVKVNGKLVLELEAETQAEPAQQVVLDLTFASDAEDKSFTGSLFVPKDNPITLKAIVKRFDPDAVDGLPDFALPVPGFFLSYTKGKPALQGVAPAAPAPKGKLLLGVRPMAGMLFSDLPMVGNALPAGTEIGIKNLLFVYAGDTFSADEVKKINGLLPPEFQLTKSDEQPEKFEKGLLITGCAQLGQKMIGIYMPVGKKNAVQRRGVAQPASEASGAPSKWFKVAKRLGPLYISRVGFAFPESRLTILLEAELVLGPLTLTLQGFSIGSRLDRFEPVPGLEGFGLSFKNPPVEISALFLKIGDNVPSGAPSGVVVKDRFAGVAVIKTSKLSISAIGEYASTNRGPSFYLFAYIGYPLGGPPFFFVEGLALGFGFNRTVRLPEISEINRHPFVAIALSPSGSLIELAESIISGNYVPISPGNIFLAIGIRFTTFKLLDSFALIVAVFGNNTFRLNLLGVSKLVLPPGAKEAGAPPLAEITLNLRGAFVPEEGFFGLEAQLTSDSYLLSRSCTLQGGFAFYTWFKGQHAGDFVLTLGGYHPRYRKPAHYPNVPRLGFNWQVGSTVQIKGQMYFALTPTAVMAGGRLEAVWDSGSLKAWFIIGADFLISWKPYFYDINLYLQFGVSFTFWFFGQHTISVELSADLHIWGPEFSGTASIDIRVTSFTVHFGAQTTPDQDALTWGAFRESFLPERVLGMTISAGLIAETPDGAWIVDPDRLVFEIESVVPNKKFRVEGTELFSETPAIGAGPMLTSTLDTSMDIDLDELGGGDFIISPIRKSVPAALWGVSTSTKPEVNPAKRLIPNVLSGLRFEAKAPAPPDTIASIKAEFLAFNEDPHPAANTWALLGSFGKDSIPASDINETLLRAFKTADLVPIPLSRVTESSLKGLDLTVDSVLVGAY